VLEGVPHPFGRTSTRRLGEPLELSGRAVVFSNELFDAQPCDRYLRTSDGWGEILVERLGDTLREIQAPVTALPGDLPPDAPEGYRFDAPREATRLAETIANAPWQGLFIAFDYGKSYVELATETPQGSARAYYRHRQSNDLLARPGEQDLTCHVCWDWIQGALTRSGFAVDAVRAQDTFLVTQAGEALERLLQEEAGHFSRRKQAVMQLLHPAHLGRKFQVLTAWRSGGE
jgi:SAM-dependent MidA family methyltransferase